MAFGYDANWIDPKCAEYDNPILRWIAGCPDLSIAPVLNTPAAPRSVAELSSGLWTPADVSSLTAADLLAKREIQKNLDLVAGGNISTFNDGIPPASPGSGLTVTEMLLLGALGFIGIGAIVKVLK